MANTTDEHDLDQEIASDEQWEEDGEPVLAPQLDPRWALGWVHVLVIGFFAALFLLMDYVPLRGTDLWLHVTYGQWILQHGTLPAEDPFCPLAQGTPVVASAWLSQVLYAAIDRVGGWQWLSHLFAFTTLASYLVLARACYLPSGRPAAALVGSLAMLTVGWSRLTTIRPENFGMLAFAILLWWAARSHTRQQSGSQASYVAVPAIAVLMGLWANLHGSFVCGMALLGCLFAGSFLETLWASRSLRTALADRQTLVWLAITAAALAATLINPYGPKLLVYSVTFAENENLRDLIEWERLDFSNFKGWAFLASWPVLGVAWWRARRPVPVAYLLMLALFGAATLLGVRMAGWYAAVYALTLCTAGFRRAGGKEGDRSMFSEEVSVAEASQTAEKWSVPRPPAEEPRAGAEESQVESLPGGIPPGRSFAWSLVGVLLVWVAFALSPLSASVMGRSPRPPAKLLDSATPLAVVAYLHKQPPQAAIYNPQWWGDWLVYAGPAGLRPFMTSNVHLISRQAWLDYRQISDAGPGWESLLDRYGVNTLLVDRRNQPALAAAVERSSRWRATYTDAQTIVLVRASVVPPT